MKTVCNLHKYVNGKCMYACMHNQLQLSHPHLKLCMLVNGENSDMRALWKSFQPFLICIPSQHFLQRNKWRSALLTDSFFLCYLSCKSQRTSMQTPRGQCTNHMQKVPGTWKPKSGTDFKQKWKHHPGLGKLKHVLVVEIKCFIILKALTSKGSI